MALQAQQNSLFDSRNIIPRCPSDVRRGLVDESDEEGEGDEE